jgi:TatA/E family protein of Tat protein translocase
MFNIGAGEWLLIVVAVVVLFALGKLPDVARHAGKALRTYRDAQSSVRRLKDPTQWIDLDKPPDAPDREPPPKS